MEKLKVNIFTIMTIFFIIMIATIQEPRKGLNVSYLILPFLLVVGTSTNLIAGLICRKIIHYRFTINFLLHFGVAFIFGMVFFGDIFFTIFPLLCATVFFIFDELIVFNRKIPIYKIVIAPLILLLLVGFPALYTNLMSSIEFEKVREKGETKALLTINEENVEMPVTYRYSSIQDEENNNLVPYLLPLDTIGIPEFRLYKDALITIEFTNTLHDLSIKANYLDLEGMVQEIELIGNSFTLPSNIPEQVIIIRGYSMTEQLTLNVAFRTGIRDTF